jgi:hypothetical protein
MQQGQCICLVVPRLISKSRMRVVEAAYLYVPEASARIHICLKYKLDVFSSAVSYLSGHQFQFIHIIFLVDQATCKRGDPEKVTVCL